MSTLPELFLVGYLIEFILFSNLQTIHGSELVFVENSGHMVMLEAPAQTNSIIWRFLSKSLSRFNSAIKINSQLRDKLMTAESAV